MASFDSIAKDLASGKSWADLVDEEEEQAKSLSDSSPRRFTPSPRQESPSACSSTSELESVSPQSSGSGVYRFHEEEVDYEKEALGIKDRCVLLLGTTDMSEADVYNMLEGFMISKLMVLIHNKTGEVKPFYYVMFSDKETMQAALAKVSKLQNPKTLRPVDMRPLDPVEAYQGQDATTIRVVGMYKFVSHSNLDAVRKQAATHFSSFGAVRRVNVHTPKGRNSPIGREKYGTSPQPHPQPQPQVFVTFFHPASASLALMFTHNSLYKGEKLNVVFAQDRC